MINIFIDTEFTDFVDPQLISLGMVAETGEEFYVELPYDLQRCSGFVKETVLPMLGYAPEAQVAKDDLYAKIIQWLRIVRQDNAEVRVCFDYQTDWDLFVGALDSKVPAWCVGRLVANCINEALRCEYHEKNRLPEHHALNDARANRYAFREAPNAIVDVVGNNFPPRTPTQ
ncbi:MULTISPECIES: 3'-5' exoribonuclease [Herbaspirillum]|uniref:3'-5' exoribonuclease n=1 Tax=Herbaspirillum huttiense subsp. lycopersici TaxID=3074428 RepID=A0ABU2EUM0_9BURK|nr:MULTISPECIES: 3'-5' exoribonuclease [Herbaspirillum]AON52329.1 hypothetical protein Hsc_0012 [Herbaspirillum seropedicae]MDR9851844.1 3'-5' exoribonuclease [Herbaspirillum huttiense SE1]